MERSRILSLRNITKTYPGVRALDDVSMDVQKGEVHAVVGENGAGKSTLMKVLTGAVRPDSGEIELEGRVYRHLAPHQAFEMGIAAIYQEFNLIPFLTVAENIFFGKEIRRGPFLRRSQMNAEAARLLAALAVEIDPEEHVANLRLAYQQIVEIAKALSREAGILIMDEPSASLTANEVDRLFDLVRTLRAKGVAIVYVSHKMSEILELADRVTVLRDGKLVRTLDVRDADRRKLISLMVGRELGESYPQKGQTGEDILLEVRNLRTAGGLNDVSFTLRRGEILGFGGLVGAGRTELVRAIFGADPVESGDILLEGKKIAVTSPRQAIRHGIGLVPEDRKQHGILAGMSVRENISYSSLKTLSRLGVIKEREETKVAAGFGRKLNIKSPDLKTPVGNLSGGNQQKVVLSKWLAARCKILMFDEPTRGIDVGAKQEIYEIMRQLTQNNCGVMFVSSEMPELIGMADRVLVMRAGRIVGSFPKGQATPEAVLHLAMEQ
ncbi:MAG: sugar ABC transporter ATP-binding protein [Planctomycetota bacterium]|jgi:ribose transport system ATP-binding protein